MSPLRPGRSGLRSGLLAASLTLLAGAAAAQEDAQEREAPPAAAAPSAPAPQSEHLAPPLLDQMLAPIALYPDALLSQVLMASTYPLEVIEAYRWVSDPGNAALKGPALESALAALDWDPSVKSLVPFPDVLKIMNDRLAWMQQLGNAFLSQPQDVMDSVQRLRSQAAAAGNLKPNPQERVITEQQTIIIQPASPEVVYVPVYDPLLVYGPWPWPAYPPVFFGPFARHSIRAGMFSWFSFGVLNLYWGWNSCDWRDHYIHIDRDRYDRIGGHRDHPSFDRDRWEHDPRHRRGVAYPDPDLRARYQPNPIGSPDLRRDYRGFTPGGGAPGAPVPVKKAAPGVESQSPERSAPARATAAPAQPAEAAGPRAPAESGGPAAHPVFPRPSGPAIPQPSFGHAPAPREAGTPRVPPAFENFTSGDAVRAAIERARNSRQSTPAPAAPLPSPSSPGAASPAAPTTAAQPPAVQPPAADGRERPDRNRRDMRPQNNPR